LLEKAAVPDSFKESFRLKSKMQGSKSGLRYHTLEVGTENTERHFCVKSVGHTDKTETMFSFEMQDLKKGTRFSGILSP
jgi:hypothetical protein